MGNELEFFDNNKVYLILLTKKKLLEKRDCSWWCKDLAACTYNMVLYTSTVDFQTCTCLLWNPMQE